MRKKTILSVGAIALALGVGVTAMNAGSFLSLPFAAVLTADSYLVTKGALPVSGSIIPEWQKMKSCQFEFTNANPGTFPGLELVKNTSEKILVQRSASGNFDDAVTVWEIDPNDPSAVAVDRTYQTRLNVVFPEALTVVEGASQTAYRVLLPAGVVRTTTGTELNPDDPGSSSSEVNPAVSADYIVKKMASWTTSPRSGQTLSTIAGGLLSASVDFQAGTTLQLVGNQQATLYLVDPAQNYAAEKVDTYTLSLDGTKVNLTLDSGSQPAIPTNRKYYRIVVPAGALSVNYDGSIQENQEIVIDNIGLTFLDASCMEFDGLPAWGSECPVKETPKEFTVILPAPMTLATNLTASIYIESSTISVATYKGTAAPNKQTITYVMNPQSSPTSKVNYPDWWSSGNYYIRFNASQFTDPATNVKNAVINTPTWKGTDGITSNPMTYPSGNTSTTLYEDTSTGRVKVDPSPIKTYNDQTALLNIDAEYGIYNWTVRLLNSAKPDVNNTVARIRLVKEGQEEPLFEQGVPVDGGVAQTNVGHLWSSSLPYCTGSQSPTKMKAASNSQTWYILYNVVDEPGYWSGTTSKNQYCKFDFLKEPGKYHLMIDEGFFVDATNMPSQAIDIPFNIQGPIEYTLSPALNSEVSVIDEVTLTYPEGAKVVLNGTPTTTLQENSLLEKTYGTFAITAKDNVVTLKLDKPYNLPNQYGFRIPLTAGMWTITYDGDTQNNVQEELYYKISIMPGQVDPSNDQPVQSADLKSILYKSDVTITNISEDDKNCFLYSVAADGTRTKIADYTSSMPSSGNDQSDATTMELTWATTANLNNLPDGTYEFVIPKEVLIYPGGQKATQDFVYTYTVATPVQMGKLTDHITLVTPPSLEADENNTQTPMGSLGMGVVALGLNTANFEGVGTEPIQMFYVDSNNPTAEPELVSSFLPQMPSQFLVMMGAGAFADGDDLISFNPTNILYMMFADGDKLDDEANIAKFTRTGYYVVVIPDGAFKANGELLQGTELQFHYTSGDKPFDYTWTITPDAAVEITENAAKVFGQKGTGITLTVNGAKFIDYKSGPATLTTPEGNVLTVGYPTIDQSAGSITWKFGTAADAEEVWPNGEYTFSILEGKIGIDMGWEDDWTKGGNFPATQVIYKVNDPTVSVALVGVDAADSYNVYTLDGKVVKVNATPADMLELTPGLYIINGKKALVRK
ncbi:MAG: hypothetical protein HDS25_01405 [Bacteroides sp.]|nr:hypothetical protein [Bacteroides sp.]